MNVVINSSTVFITTTIIPYFGLAVKKFSKKIL